MCGVIYHIYGRLEYLDLSLLVELETMISISSLNQLDPLSSMNRWLSNNMEQTCKYDTISFKFLNFITSLHKYSCNPYSYLYGDTYTMLKKYVKHLELLRHVQYRIQSSSVIGQVHQKVYFLKAIEVVHVTLKRQSSMRLHGHI